MPTLMESLRAIGSNSFASGLAFQTSPLHINTAFDPLAKYLKVVVIGSPSDAAKLLEMRQLLLGSHS